MHLMESEIRIAVLIRLNVLVEWVVKNVCARTNE